MPNFAVANADQERKRGNARLPTPALPRAQSIPVPSSRPSITPVSPANVDVLADGERGESTSRWSIPTPSFQQRLEAQSVRAEPHPSVSSDRSPSLRTSLGSSQGHSFETSHPATTNPTDSSPNQRVHSSLPSINHPVSETETSLQTFAKLVATLQHRTIDLENRNEGLEKRTQELKKDHERDRERIIEVLRKVWRELESLEASNNTWYNVPLNVTIYRSELWKAVNAIDSDIINSGDPNLIGPYPEPFQFSGSSVDMTQSGADQMQSDAEFG